MKSSRVLLVDDSDVNLMLYEGVLATMKNVDVDSFVSPRAAQAALRANRYDVLVVDYRMPELDGLEFISELATIETASDALVIMVTGETDRDVRHRALELGASDFLTKPVDRLEFTARIRNLITLASSRRLLASRAEHLADEVNRATSALRRREVETIVRLTRAAEFRDNVTGMHVIRVGEMCAALGRTLGLPETDTELLGLAAPMHDIGKVATPDHILLKPGPLTAEEFTIMKQHTTAGYDILRDSDSELLQKAAEIALTHHERFDGKGYPIGLAGNEIPISGRFCSVVDVFDALTSVRPYKGAWSIDRGIAEIVAGSGSHFDPEVVNLFQESLDSILEIKKRYADGTLRPFAADREEVAMLT
ncbi:MAG TPA: HD domain-containing phosphohydrolase [Candidatus Dormibacteraeota bacterium]|nr:HD domain-containing phosphohydrolase [Candidatus Dormibacteraeota bacterium]